MKTNFLYQISTGVLTLGFAMSASASNLATRGPLVAEWISDLPEVSSLTGDKGCQAVSFPNGDQGIIALQVGDAVTQPWLGIDGSVKMDKNNFIQDFSAGGIDIPQYRVQVHLTKANGQLQSLKYRHYKVTGFIFTHEELTKDINCQSKK